MYAGHGLVLVDLAGDEAALETSVPELRQLAMEQRGSVVVTEASPHMAAQLDIWGAVSGLEVMRNLKARFDPHTVLNPGRFVGGI